MDQLSFNFSSRDDSRPSQGLGSWRSEYQEHLNALARSVGLPLGKRVRLSLLSGVELAGPLQFFEDALWVENLRAHDLHLRIGNVDVRFGEIESCVLE